MGLVEYSESESDSEAPSTATKRAPPAQPSKPQPPQSTTETSSATSTRKKPFQKVVDRGGKIVINLPQQQHGQSTSSSLIGAETDDNPDQQLPPAKRARTTAFVGFNAMLPAPRNLPKSVAAQGSKRAGVALKTSAEPGFVRGPAAAAAADDGGHGDGNDGSDDGGDAGGDALPGGISNPAPISTAKPELQKPAESVPLVGKPLMFRPLSVARSAKKKVKKSGNAMSETAAPGPKSTTPKETPTGATAPTNSAAAKSKPSLFSLYHEEPPTASAESEIQEPLFSTWSNPNPSPQPPPPTLTHPNNHDYSSSASAPSSFQGSSSTNDLTSIADDLHLSAAARRELLGRNGAAHPTSANYHNTKNTTNFPQIITFDTDREYRHNEALRAAGEQQIHQPVRALQGGGKHSLRQLVENVNNQRDALEDSFAKGKSNRKEASSRYGW